MGNENWEETFLKELTEDEVESAMEVDDEEDECDEAAIIVPKLKTYKETIDVLQDVLMRHCLLVLLLIALL